MRAELRRLSLLNIDNQCLPCGNRTPDTDSGMGKQSKKLKTLAGGELFHSRPKLKMAAQPDLPDSSSSEELLYPPDPIPETEKPFDDPCIVITIA
ncbi:Hypothetical predicted protein [Pelobates cultripes]|uniref:Uncharacterized protein n=1 Tax=Pelobates cultripes TaxID=61616 RepID=A0AAD1RSC0_PELCU|nr:Hypothetical predicted protein [Pelobates cultripes]